MSKAYDTYGWSYQNASDIKYVIPTQQHSVRQQIEDVEHVHVVGSVAFQQMLKEAELVKVIVGKRTWVGLTDEERGQIINANFGTGLWRMSKDIEAKLKDKNT